MSLEINQIISGVVLDAAVARFKEVPLKGFCDEVVLAIKTEVLSKLNKANITAGYGELRGDKVVFGGAGVGKVVCANGFVYDHCVEGGLYMGKIGDVITYTWKAPDAARNEINARREQLAKDIAEGKLVAPFPEQKVNVYPTLFTMRDGEYVIWRMAGSEIIGGYDCLIVTNMFNLYVSDTGKPDTREGFHISNWPMPDDCIRFVLDVLSFTKDGYYGDSGRKRFAFGNTHDKAGVTPSILHAFLKDYATTFWPRRPDGPVAVEIAQLEADRKALREDRVKLDADRIAINELTDKAHAALVSEKDAFTRECEKITDEDREHARLANIAIIEERNTFNSERALAMVHDRAALADERAAMLSETGQAALTAERAELTLAKEKFLSDGGQKEFADAKRTLAVERTAFVNEREKFMSDSGQRTFRAEREALQDQRLALINDQRKFEDVSGKTAISEERAALLADRARFEEEKKLWEMDLKERSASIEQRVNTLLKREIAMRFPIHASELITEDDLYATPPETPAHASDGTARHDQMSAQAKNSDNSHHCCRCGSIMLGLFACRNVDSGKFEPVCESCFHKAPAEPPAAPTAPSAQPKRTRPAISPELRQQVWEKRNTDAAHPDAGKCFCCENATTRNDFECGHVMAFTNGGATNLANLEPICRTCNRKCGTKNLIDYKMSL